MLVKRTKEGAEVKLTSSTASIAAVNQNRTCAEGEQADRQRSHFIQVDACIESHSSSEVSEKDTACHKRRRQPAIENLRLI